MRNLTDPVTLDLTVNQLAHVASAIGAAITFSPDEADQTEEDKEYLRELNNIMTKCMTAGGMSPDKQLMFKNVVDLKRGMMRPPKQ